MAAARAEVMHGACTHLLAGASLPTDQDGGTASSKLSELFNLLRQRRALSHDVPQAERLIKGLDRGIHSTGGFVLEVHAQLLRSFGQQIVLRSDHGLGDRSASRSKPREPIDRTRPFHLESLDV